MPFGNLALKSQGAPTSPLVESKAGLLYIDSCTPSISSFLSWAALRLDLTCAKLLCAVKVPSTRVKYPVQCKKALFFWEMRGSSESWNAVRLCMSLADQEEAEGE